MWQTGKVSPRDRAILLSQQPVTVWLTGLPGSGKSTIAAELELSLIRARHPCFVLDGDNIRHGLSRELGFAPDDRKENIRRVAEVAKLLNDAGLVAITAFISPYREDRAAARRIIGPERFIEVFLDADVLACEARDPKGLYAKARRGEIRDFTGVSAPYERPDSPQVTLESGRRSVEECLRDLLDVLLPRIQLPASWPVGTKA
jgi:adenylyl-sulfate kinase